MAEDQEKKFVDLHFQYETMLLGVGDGSVETVVPEPVKKGQLLVSLLDEQSDEQGTLVAGDNCELSSAENSLLAAVNGYPRWEINDKKQCIVSVEPIIIIAKDAMAAEMVLYPAVRGKKLTKDDLLDFLTSENICHGIDGAAMAEAIARTRENGRHSISFVAATGTPAIDGEDATIRYEIDLGATIGKMQEDGSLDFKERRMFIYVDEGQVIATRVPSTAGTPGKNIFGGVVEARAGRDVTVRVTEDAIFDADTGTVIAAKGGVVSVVNQSNFKVTSKQTISGDIDYNTGNIYAKNNVSITGNVKPGFVVAVRGDIEIGGHVESATVNSQGNLVVRGGVIGEQSQLSIRGDIDLNYVEKASVVAAGNIVLKKNAYYCKLEAGGDILGGSTSKIVGGRVVCGGNLQVSGIGSASAEPGFIAVGTQNKRLEKFDQLQLRIAEIEEKLLQFQQRIGKQGEKPVKMVSLEEELLAHQKTLRNINLIPGTPEDSLKNEEFSKCGAQLIVTGRIIAGTMLRIGNMTMTVEKDFTGQTFVIDEFLNTIVARSIQSKK